MGGFAPFPVVRYTVGFVSAQGQTGTGGFMAGVTAEAAAEEN